MPTSDSGTCGSPGVATLATMTYTTSHTDAHAMAQDDQFIYWLDYGSSVTGSGTVRRVSKCGGEVLTLASNLNYAGYIAVGGGFVFWDDLLEIPGDAVIVRQPVAGGAPLTIATDFNVSALAADDSFVYWLNETDVVRADYDGGHPSTLAATRGAPVDMTLASGTLYWTSVEGDAGNVLATPTAGGTTTTLATFSGDPVGIAVDEHAIYFGSIVAFGEETLLSVPVGGGATTTLTSGPVTAVASDGVSLYWDDDSGDVDAGAILKRPASGGGITTLVSGESSAVVGLLVDGTYLYWLNDGMLMRMAK